MSTAPLPFPMNHELHTKLDEIVALTGKPPERILDEALTDYQARAVQKKCGGEQEQGNTEESALEVAMRLGLLGKGYGGPNDLSTNPKHMEGFGLSDQ